jgi:undecaprenyl diphosphate synthase
MQKVPRHIAIIMDGNGRWAQSHNKPRTFGHAEGVERAREITRECSRLGVESLTLYTFSTENWQRPAFEVNFLMKLLTRYLANESRELIENNVRFKSIGMRSLLPQEVQKEIIRLEEISSKNTGLTLNLALSYGSRQEITEAAKSLAKKIESGELRSQDIDENMFEGQLFTAGQAAPDLLIRTGGDQRISNFLLWQIAYAELVFLPVCWPDFKVEQLTQALEEFAARERRFGKVNESDESSGTS